MIESILGSATYGDLRYVPFIAALANCVISWTTVNRNICMCLSVSQDEEVGGRRDKSATLHWRLKLDA